jgi:hypothetical protein
MQSHAPRLFPRARIHVAGWVLAASALACTGCQAFAPGAVPGAFAARDEKQIVKLAKNDPFPSPADVGLDQPTPVP